MKKSVSIVTGGLLVALAGTALVASPSLALGESEEVPTAAVPEPAAIENRATTITGINNPGAVIYYPNGQASAAGCSSLPSPVQNDKTSYLKAAKAMRASGASINFSLYPCLRQDATRMVKIAKRNPAKTKAGLTSFAAKEIKAATSKLVNFEIVRLGAVPVRVQNGVAKIGGTYEAGLAPGSYALKLTQDRVGSGAWEPMNKTINFKITGKRAAMVAPTLYRKSGCKLNRKPLKLAGCDLEGMKLKKRVLGRTNLIGANLTNANLAGQNLKGADLRFANLSGANLTGTNLVGARLQHATLNGTNATGANFSRAKMRGVKLVDVNAENANFSRAALTAAYISGNDFANANLSSVSFVESSLASQVFPSSGNIQNSNWSHTILNVVTLKEQSFAGVHSGGIVVMPQAMWTVEEQNPPEPLISPAATGVSNGYFLAPGVNLRKAKLITNAYFVGGLEGVGGSGADLTGADLTGANVTSIGGSTSFPTFAILTSANLHGANINQVNFTNWNLNGANFTDSTIANSNMSAGTMNGANFTGSTITNFTIFQALPPSTPLKAQASWQCVAPDMQGAIMHNIQSVNGAPTLIAPAGSSICSEQTLVEVDQGSSGVAFIGHSLSGAGLDIAGITIPPSQWGGGGITLTGTDFTNANLNGTGFSGNTLGGSNFTGATLIGADLAGTDLTSVNFTGAYLMNANVSGTSEAGGPTSPPVFTNVNASGANFTGSQLQGASFDNAYMDSAILTSANLTGGSLNATILSNATMSETTFNQIVNTEGLSLAGSNLNNSNWEESSILSANLTGADFSNSLMENVQINSSDITDAEFDGVTFGVGPTVGSNNVGPPASLPTGFTFDVGTGAINS